MIYARSFHVHNYCIVFQCPSNKWPSRSAAKPICLATRGRRPAKTTRNPRTLPAFSWLCGLKSQRKLTRRTEVITGDRQRLHRLLANRYSRKRVSIIKQCIRIMNNHAGYSNANAGGKISLYSTPAFLHSKMPSAFKTIAQPFCAFLYIKYTRSYYIHRGG